MPRKVSMRGKLEVFIKGKRYVINSRDAYHGGAFDPFVEFAKAQRKTVSQLTRAIQLPPARIRVDFAELSRLYTDLDRLKVVLDRVSKIFSGENLSKLLKDAYFGSGSESGRRGASGYLSELDAYLHRAGAFVSPTPTGSARPSDRRFHNYWTPLLDALIAGKGTFKPAVKQSTTGATIATFSLADLKSIEIKNTRSRFKSIFMIEEFGTGQLATASRSFVNATRTFYKVPPYLAALFGDPAAVDLWWPDRRQVLGAQNKYMEFLKRSKEDVKKQKSKYRLSWEEYLRTKKGNPLNWAYGRESGGFYGFPARHLFYDTRGNLVNEIRELQRRFQQIFTDLIRDQLDRIDPRLSNIVYI